MASHVTQTHRSPRWASVLRRTSTPHRPVNLVVNYCHGNTIMRTLLLLFALVSPTSAQDLYTQVTSLVGSPLKMPEDKRDQLLAINLDDPGKGVLGLKFGMSLDTVVSIWGKPRSISVGPNRRSRAAKGTLISIDIHGSTFRFADNKLVEMRILNVHFPNWQPFKGKINPNDPSLDLLKVFPGSKETGKTSITQEVELPNLTRVLIQKTKAKIISVGIRKPHW